MDNKNPTGDFVDQIRAMADATMIEMLIKEAPANIKPMIKSLVSLLAKYGIKGRDAVNFIFDLSNVMSALDGLGLGPKGEDDGWHSY